MANDLSLSARPVADTDLSVLAELETERAMLDAANAYMASRLPEAGGEVPFEVWLWATGRALPNLALWTWPC